MVKVIQEFCAYNLIEALFITMMYGAFSKIKFSIKNIIVFVIILALLNVIIKLLLPIPIVMQLVGVLSIALFFTLIYKNRFLRNFKYIFIIMFGIMLISEMALTFIYGFVFNIHIENIPNMLTRWIYFLPVYMIDFIIYFAYLKIRRVNAHEVVGRSN